MGPQSPQRTRSCPREDEHPKRLVLVDLDKDLVHNRLEFLDARRVASLIEQLLRIPRRVVAVRVVRRILDKEHICGSRIQRVGIETKHYLHVPRVGTRDFTRTRVGRPIGPLVLLGVFGNLLLPVLFVELCALNLHGLDVDASVFLEFLGNELGHRLIGVISGDVIETKFYWLAARRPQHIATVAVVRIRDGFFDTASGRLLAVQVPRPVLLNRAVVLWVPPRPTGLPRVDGIREVAEDAFSKAFF